MALRDRLHFLLRGAFCCVALGFNAWRLRADPDQRLHDRPDGPARTRVYAIRYVVSFTVLALALPLIAFVYDSWGFDALFRILAVTAAAILDCMSLLPRRLPSPAAATA